MTIFVVNIKVGDEAWDFALLDVDMKLISLDEFLWKTLF
jgi:hypothetical protein